MAGQKLNALDAENAVAGSILIDPLAYTRIADMLSPDSFRSEPCRLVFQAAQALAAEGKEIDPLTIAKHIGGAVDNATLAQLMEITPTAANAEYYAKIVLDHSRRREVRSLAEHILADDSTPTDSLIANTSAAVATLVESSVGSRCVTSSDMMHSFFDDLVARETGKRNFLSTGFSQLDKILGGGFLNGGLYILAARPGMGKTTLALNLAENFRGGVLFVSLEMSENQLTAKRMARETGIPSNRLLLGNDLSEGEYEKICAAASKLSQSGVVANRRMGATVPEISVMARSVKGLSAIVVDYLGLVQSDQSGSRYETVTEISGALKRLAMSLNVPVLALAQLNRASDARADKRPALSDLRDSGAIEQDADGVLLLYRADYYQKGEAPKPWVPSLIECEVAKNRHAATGMVRFNGFLALSRITEV